MPTTTVMIRARPETREALREIAAAESATVVDTLERLVQREREARLYAALEADLTAQAAEIAAETRSLDTGTAADGLDPDESFAGW